jgi:hypothetical protein
MMTICNFMLFVMMREGWWWVCYLVVGQMYTDCVHGNDYQEKTRGLYECSDYLYWYLPATITGTMDYLLLLYLRIWLNTTATSLANQVLNGLWLPFKKVTKSSMSIQERSSIYLFSFSFLSPQLLSFNLNGLPVLFWTMLSIAFWY